MWIIPFSFGSQEGKYMYWKKEYVVDRKLSNKAMVLFHAFSHPKYVFLFIYEAINSSSLKWLKKIWENAPRVGKLWKLFFKTCVEN